MVSVRWETGLGLDDWGIGSCRILGSLVRYTPGLGIEFSYSFLLYPFLFCFVVRASFFVSGHLSNAFIAGCEMKGIYSRYLQ